MSKPEDEKRRYQPATPSSVERLSDPSSGIKLAHFDPSDPRWRRGPDGIPVGLASLIAEAKASQDQGE